MRTKLFIAAFVAALGMTTTKAYAETMNEGDASREILCASGLNTYKYVYNMDEQGRVTQKIRYQQDAKGCWMPNVAYTVFYGDQQTVVTCAYWNGRTFTKNAQQVYLDAKEYPTAINAPK